ncbi:MAG: hypothetical protein ACTSVI_01460 [Promethearchaeota archaeon]
MRTALYITGIIIAFCGPIYTLILLIREGSPYWWIFYLAMAGVTLLFQPIFAYGAFKKTYTAEKEYTAEYHEAKSWEYGKSDEVVVSEKTISSSDVKKNAICGLVFFSLVAPFAIIYLLNQVYLTPTLFENIFTSIIVYIVIHEVGMIVGSIGIAK